MAGGHLKYPIEVVHTVLIRTRRLRASALALTGAMVLTLACATPALVEPTGCAEVRLPVRLATESPADQVVAGTLCPPLAPGVPDEVDVLTPGSGSVVRVEAAGTYRDEIDRFVVTVGHAPGVGAGRPAVFASPLDPAPLDPAFRDAGLGAGYVATIPGRGGGAFYSATADPAVVADDEAHKDVFSLTAVASGMDSFVLPPLLTASSRVEVPVLVVVGGDDTVFCALPDALACDDAALHALEVPHYTVASFHVMRVSGTGHDLPLRPSADASFDAVDSWIDGS